MSIQTRIRLMSANFRLTPESPEDIAAGHTWAVRKPLTINLLKTWAPSVICGQECSTTIRNDLATGLGSPWKFIRNGNVIIFYDTNHHNLISSKTAMLPTAAGPDGTTDPRRLVLIRLQMKATGAHWWAASTHFTAGGDPAWRVKQMTAVLDFIKANGDLANTILGGDVNSSLMDDEGPRTVARAAGLFDLRSKLAAPRIRNVTATTFPGWVEPSPHDNRWIDDICAGENFQPYYGRVVETNGASDHNFLIASSIQLS
jgi:endonuclease/exonuclease/phosphatase family metal-dependent hydrolase